MNKKLIYGLIALAVLAVVFYVVNAEGNGAKSGVFQTVSAYEGDMTIYKSQSCGCCGIYSQYFKSNGNENVGVSNIPDSELGIMKEELGVPQYMESCHTTILKSSDGREYFVEGHIPLEAIEKLLQEQPDIKGIAMPGMPEGSPGMPGAKRGDFVIYAVNSDGTTSEWMRI